MEKNIVIKNNNAELENRLNALEAKDSFEIGTVQASLLKRKPFIK